MNWKKRWASCGSYPMYITSSIMMSSALLDSIFPLFGTNVSYTLLFIHDNFIIIRKKYRQIGIALSFMQIVLNCTVHRYILFRSNSMNPDASAFFITLIICSASGLTALRISTILFTSLHRKRLTLSILI